MSWIPDVPRLFRRSREKTKESGMRMCECFKTAKDKSCVPVRVSTRLGCVDPNTLVPQSVRGTFFSACWDSKCPYFGAVGARKRRAGRAAAWGWMLGCGGGGGGWWWGRILPSDWIIRVARAEGRHKRKEVARRLSKELGGHARWLCRRRNNPVGLVIIGVPRYSR